MIEKKFDPNDEIYLKDYLKQYFLSNLSIGERVDNYKNLIIELLFSVFNLTISLVFCNL